MNELHLFAGAGGGILGGQLLGHTCVCAVEIEEYCQQVLLQRQQDGILPKFPIWDDVTTFEGGPWRGIVDVVCGGFPCQDISSAGKGAGLSGERSGLWSEMARIIGEVQPTYAFVENSPVLTSRGLNIVLGDLAQMGYDARWGVYGADDIDGDHHRERIWILAHASCIDEEQPEVVRSGKMLGQHRGITSYVPREVRSSEWKIYEPSMVGMDDDMANWMGRASAIGNGQVPAVATYAWNRLMSVNEMIKNSRSKINQPDSKEGIT